MVKDLMIDDILGIAKPESTEIGFEEHFDLMNFLITLTKMIQMKAHEKKITFSYDIPDNLPRRIDKSHSLLRKVLLCLLNKTIQIAESKVVFSVSRLSQQHWSFSVETPEFASLLVKFPITELTHIQQILERIDSKLSTDNGFYFELELQEVLEDSSISITGFQGAQKRILIADINQEDLTIAKTILLSLEFTVETVSNSSEIFHQLEAFTPDALLMDLVMPDMNGLEIIQKIRQISQYKNLTIIVHSANTLEDIQSKTIQIGANDFIAKPLKVKKLLLMLQKHLHLEWTYENISKQLPISSPPSEQLKELLELAKKQSLSEIKRWVKKNRTTHQEHQEFFDYITESTKRYQFQEMIEFIEKLLD